jgi:KaiC/GvpD/RAD55 family RecA-like ATPase
VGPSRLLTLEEIKALPDLLYLIAGVLPEHSFCVLYGEPGCGKTFVALSMALQCASGAPWLGRPTRRAQVLYVAAEGGFGMKYRLRAYRLRSSVEPDSMLFCVEAIQIADEGQIESLQQELTDANFRPDLIVVDTLARVAVGRDENSARDMGEIVAAAEALRRSFDASILLIHHTRKDGGSERGSSALRGAADVMIECKSTQFVNIVTLTSSKMKDDEPFADIEIGLEKVDVSHGRTSLVAGPPPSILQRPRLAGQTTLARQGDHIVQILMNDFGESGASHRKLRDAYCSATRASKSTFDRALREVMKAGKVLKAGEGKSVGYFPIGVSANIGVSECRDTALIAVK